MPFIHKELRLHSQQIEINVVEDNNCKMTHQDFTTTTSQELLTFQRKTFSRTTNISQMIFTRNLLTDSAHLNHKGEHQERVSCYKTTNNNMSHSLFKR